MRLQLCQIFPNINKNLAITSEFTVDRFLTLPQNFIHYYQSFKIKKLARYYILEIWMEAITFNNLLRTDLITQRLGILL